MASLDNRLDILEKGGRITADIRETLDKLINLFQMDYGVALDEANGGRFITHIAVALMRVKHNEPVGPIDREAYEEFESSSCFQRSKQMALEIMDKLSLDLPEEEVAYIEINICLILDEDDENQGPGTGPGEKEDAT